MTELLSIESPQANINRARFSSKDFFTFVDDIIARIQVLFVTEFNDFISSGTGVMLIDIISWACETLSFYIDRQASESYISTAKLRKSVNRLARNIGYKMRGAVSSSVDLEVNLTQVYGFDVTIPIGFQFKGPEDLVYEAVESVTFPAGEGPTSPARTISCSQGTTITRIFTSNGEKNQSFRLNPGENKFVATNSVITTVGGELWEENSFISFDQTNQYEVDYNNDPVLINFGDGVAGNIPTNTYEIKVDFRSTSGSIGDVLSGKINDVVNPLVVSFEIIGLTITNPNNSSGGSNRETIEEAKRNAPLWFYAREVAVTEDDYIGLAQAFSDPVAGTVAVAQAFVALGADDDLTLVELINNIRGIINPISTTIQTSTSQISSDVSNISGYRDDAENESGNITTDLATLSGSSSVVKNTSEGIKNRAVQINVDSNDIKTHVINGKAQVIAYGPTPGTGNLDASQVLAINGHFDLIDAEANNIISQGTQIQSDSDNIITEINTIDSNIVNITTANSNIALNLTSMTPKITSISNQIVLINNEITSNFENSINDYLDDIYNHVDGFLASDCKSNLVQVPILTKDSDGFFQAPSTALIRALETYLNERKEVTQIIEVVSGGVYLVAAVISGTIGIYSGYVQATVLSNVRNALDNILKNREFGKNLWLSDILTVAPNIITGIGGIDGVSYANIRITGPISYLDSNGNLIITKDKVITKGSYSLTAVTSS